MNQLIYRTKSIHFKTYGSGSPVFLLHGFCEDARVWDEFIQLLPEKHQYITIDFPGFGQSEVVENISISDMAEIVHLVATKLDLRNPVVIGHSMGGYVALAYAEKYNKNLQGLGLFHSHPYEDSAEKKEDRTKHIEFIEKNGAIHFIKQLYTNLFIDGFSRFNSMVYNNQVYQASQYTNEAIIYAIKAMQNRVDRSKVLEELDCPALFIIGKKDKLVSDEFTQGQITLAKKALIDIIPEAGHMGMFEAPKQCSEAVTKFLNLCHA